MNHCLFTGWLPADVEVRVMPSGREMLLFALVIPGDDGLDDVQERVSVYEERLVAKCRDVLTRGRTVMVHCRRQVIKVPKAGGDQFFNAFVALELEVPDRSNPMKREPVAALKEAAA